jgi:hypothetical protein
LCSYLLFIYQNADLIIFSPSQLAIFGIIIIVASHFIPPVIQNTLGQSINPTS